MEKMKHSLRRPELITPPKEEAWAAVAIILRLIVDVEVLFIKRKKNYEDPWSGQIALPGGRFKEIDGNTLRSVIREVDEEVGLKLSANAIVGMLDVISPSNMPELNVVPYVAVLEKEDELKLGEEISYAFWAPVSELQKSSVKVNIKSGRPKTVKAYRYGGETIWGMTAKLIEKLITIL